MGRSAKRILATTATVVAAALVATALGVGWYYADELNGEALAVEHEPEAYDLVVSDIGDGTISLGVTGATDLEYGSWRTAGVWGLKGDNGYGTLGAIVELGDGAVVRNFEPVRGDIASGDRVRLDGAYFEGDPLTAHGLSYQQISFDSDLGPLGAWRLPGSSRTWAIFTHGKGADKTENLRYLPPFAEAGLPMLIIEYRNDEGVAFSASGFYDYGESEWKDLEAAVRYALSEGADDVVLAGTSMGGAIVASFLYQSELAKRVRAVVLDAPTLDFGDVVDFGAERRNLPAAVTWLGKTTASLRFGFTWRDRDYLRRADELNVPILLFHGDTDRTVHVRSSDALAEARPDLVTYVRVAGATHASAWNHDPTRFEQAVRDFLRANVGRRPREVRKAFSPVGRGL